MTHSQNTYEGTVHVSVAGGDLPPSYFKIRTSLPGMPGQPDMMRTTVIAYVLDVTSTSSEGRTPNILNGSKRSSGQNNSMHSASDTTL